MEILEKKDNKEIFLKSLSKDRSILKNINPSVYKIALQNTSAYDFPLQKNEFWKYTRLHRLIEKSFSSEATSTKLNTADIPAIFEDNVENKIVFVNGKYMADLGKIMNPESIHVLSNLTQEQALSLSKHIKITGDSEKTIFSSINSVYATDGCFIHLKSSAKLAPIHIVNVFTEAHIAFMPRNIIVLEKNTEATVVYNTFSIGHSCTFQNAVNEIYIHENAHLQWYNLQQKNEESFIINTTQVEQQKNSSFNSFYISTGGNITRNNLTIHLNDEHAETHLYGLTLGKNKNHIDHHTFIQHEKPNCESNEIYKSILNDSSTGVFNGKIYVQRDAQKTNAFQSSQNILLNDNANAYSKPELEIYADDVKCSHGSTIGQLDEEAKFYLKARGIGDKEATKLLVQAFAADVVNKVKSEEIKNYIIENILETYFN